MKKILVVAVLALATVPAMAQWHHHGYQSGYYGGGSGWNFSGGAIAGAVIYDIYNRPVVIQQQPVIVQNPPVVYQTQQNCTPWTETQHPDGTVTRTRTCTQ